MLMLAAGEDESVGQSKHDDSVVAPSVFEYFPEPQLSHALAPALALNLPASQLVQSPPLGPVVPGSHSQSERDELPAGDDDDAGQLGTNVLHIESNG